MASESTINQHQTSTWLDPAFVREMERRTSLSSPDGSVLIGDGPTGQTVQVPVVANELGTLAVDIVAKTITFTANFVTVLRSFAAANSDIQPVTDVLVFDYSGMTAGATETIELGWMHWNLGAEHYPFPGVQGLRQRINWASEKAIPEIVGNDATTTERDVSFSNSSIRPVFDAIGRFTFNEATQTITERFIPGTSVDLHWDENATHFLWLPPHTGTSKLALNNYRPPGVAGTANTGFIILTANMVDVPIYLGVSLATLDLSAPLFQAGTTAGMSIAVEVATLSTDADINLIKFQDKFIRTVTPAFHGIDHSWTNDAGEVVTFNGGQLVKQV